MILTSRIHQNEVPHWGSRDEIFVFRGLKLVNLECQVKLKNIELEIYNFQVNLKNGKNALDQKN